MKRKSLALILFFSGLWGLSEACLGGVLYRADVPRASVILTIIAFGILTLARFYLPRFGSCTLIASCAMLYKLLNEPLFACHFLGIVMLGLSYDLFFSLSPIKNKALSAIAAVYLNYVSFAFIMAYVIRYSPWVRGGLDKVLTHIGVGGTLAALGCAVIVPLSHRFGQWLQTKKVSPGKRISPFAQARLALVTAGMWGFALAAFIMHFRG